MRAKLSLWLPTRSRSKAAAIATSGAERAELFVTTKVWNDQLSPDALRRAFDISLAKLKLDYVDLCKKANLEALSISPDDEDRAANAALPKDQRFVPPPFAPEWDAVV
jgi:hypothetical protein